MKFASKAGAILAAAGSAVGLGNIWRFPFETGNNGGAAFILIYIACILLMGLPIMVAEFIIGRHTHSNTAGAYKKLAPGTHWGLVGLLGVTTGFLILGYYTVVAGWTLDYILQALQNGFQGKTPDEFISSFNALSQGSWRPIIWLLLFMFGTHLIIIKGVQSGIEKSSKILMPVLFLLLLGLGICSITLPDSMKGISFLFHPDFSQITSKTVLNAVGQSFFSLSLGMGCLCTYASYFTQETSLTKSALSICAIDTMVAILAGVIIFPAAFSVGIQPDAGASLVFITLPNVFTQAFSGMPVLSYVLSLLFYVLLALAALTSTISMHEVVTVYIHEEFHVSRKKASWIVTIVCSVIGILCSLSLGVGKELALFGKSLFDCFDYLTAKIMLPVGGFFISIYAGWFLDKKIFKSEIESTGTVHPFLTQSLIFILRFIAPICLLLIFLNETGLI